MGQSLWTGPIISAGSLCGTPGAPDPNFRGGPSILYQAEGIPDVRGLIPNGDIKVGSILGHLNTAYITVMNAVPAASAATPVNIAAAQNVVSGTSLTLAGASAGVTPAIPFYNEYGSSALLVSALTLDMGFGSVVTTAGNQTITPSTGTIGRYMPGMQIVIGNAGNAGGSVPLITRVLTVGPTTATVSMAPLASLAAAPVGMANLLNPLSNFGATSWRPRAPAGVLAALDPAEVAGRGIAITGSASATGGPFTGRGYDIYGIPMSETITATAGATTTYGRKAFKHLISVTPGFTDAHNYSVGTSDVLGFALRSDLFEENEIYAAGAFITANTGFTAADPTAPATSTTGDVRGTAQIGTRGPLGTGVGAASLNGSIRVKLAVLPSLYNMVIGTGANPVPMYGVTQA